MLRLPTVVFLVFALLTIAYNCEGGRKPPFNGSIFGKRFIRDMESDSRLSDVRHPACEYVLEACNQWFMAGQETQ